jgi:hypothetical protein
MCCAGYAPLVYVTLAALIFYLPPFQNFHDYLMAGLWLYGGLALLAFVDLAIRFRPLPIRRPA